jgi:Fe-Mn family superoxide dismutase
MSELHSFRLLFEKAQAEDQNIHQIKLPVTSTKLKPVFSEDSVDLHYGVLYKNYVKKALAGEGEFQVAGAKLHTLFFEQFQEPKSPNSPIDAIKTLIDSKFGSFQKFQTTFTETALTIHGSGWIYLDKSGKIKTIPNHKVVDDVAIIVDMWEHSYILDYGSNKEKYLKEIWKVINWAIVNSRIN